MPTPSSHQFWAKLRYRDDDPSTGEIVDWHPLVAHSADVAAVTEALLDRTLLGARLARLAGLDATGGLDPVHVARLSALAALHDAGKVNAGFQNRAFGKRPQDGHVKPMIGMLSTSQKKRELTEILGLRDLLPWFGDSWKEMFSWLQTTWSHHGVPVARSAPKKGRWTDEAREELADVGQWLRVWYPHAFDDASPIEASEAQHLFNGILTLADWIASWMAEDERLGMRPDLTDPEPAMKEATERAATALDVLGFEPGRDINSSLSTILEEGKSPYDVQTELCELPTSPEGTLTILESATGSGKTEAALGRYAQLLEANLVDSMYFAVPTRAAAKQLQSRIRHARNRIFGADDPPVHLAVPGYLKVDDVEGTRFGWKVRWDEDVGPRGWAAESSKRYTSSPIAVGTVDQMLMSVLQRKHAHLRLAGLSRSLLVVDEVHASSVYMNEVLQTVVSLHRAMGGHALLMSATLGSHTRAEYTGEALKSHEKAKEEPYPLLTHVNGTQRCASVAPKPPPGGDKEVALTCKPWMKETGERDEECRTEAVARRARRAAANGAHVLIIRNTVAACREVFERIDDDLSLTVQGQAVPHHSRYCAADRADLDAAIERVYGKNEVDGRPTRTVAGGVVTVATQTVEQSLDVDADLLITDLCPMDVLLQRIGRLHRHDRTGHRPEGYAEPECVILTPTERDLTRSISASSGNGFPGPGLGSVYDDLRIIAATWDALDEAEDGEIAIPANNRSLVEDAMHPSVIDAITNSDPAWEAHESYLQDERREDVIGAGNATVDFTRAFTDGDNLFPDSPPKTRLGTEDVVVALPEEVDTPFGNTVEELTISPYLFDGDEDDRPDDGTASTVAITPEGFRFTFAGESFQYDRTGLSVP